MRYLAIAAVLSLLVLAAMSESARAVGYDVAGKEKCVCSPLVARGIYPDTLNNLKEALVLPQLGFIVERAAQEVKAILGQFGVPSEGDPRGRVDTTKGILGGETDSNKGGKRVAESETKKSPEKPRRVRLPARAM
ncbi:MAG: hypothetical protein RDU20_00350 [Desulfomonilaceae bacterium]|nr:hypothetical protein [Desulfomonilaceae bacterium]